ncbi:MAG: hypothetical protein NT129_05775 [Candidatus Aenigmarchaeota archaeon]|nr:hypothetical protein [Candidatus Aenigmarchaeota archaeon]
MPNYEWKRGDPKKPKGEAVFYWANPEKPSDIFALYTYIIPEPFSEALSLSLPSFSHVRISSESNKKMGVFMLAVGYFFKDARQIENIIDERGCDFIYTNSPKSGDFDTTVKYILEASKEYAMKYIECLGRDLKNVKIDLDESIANDVIYSLQSGEQNLAVLTNKLRELKFAVDNENTLDANIAETDIRLVSKYLPSCKPDHLIESARIRGPEGWPKLSSRIERYFKELKK